MATHLLKSSEAADRLGISRETLYDWLRQSDAGKFVLRGRAVTIAYFQGGRQGQGRIQLDSREVERLLTYMRVEPRPKRAHRPTRQNPALQHITALGRPDE